jgi:hypothetical protein
LSLTWGAITMLVDRTRLRQQRPNSQADADRRTHAQVAAPRMAGCPGWVTSSAALSADPARHGCGARDRGLPGRVQPVGLVAMSAVASVLELVDVKVDALALTG